MVTCNTCDNYDPKDRWYYSYGALIPAGKEAQQRNCSRHEPWEAPKNGEK